MAAAYSAAKAAVIGMTKAIGKDVATTGVLVNCVTPSPVETPMLGDITQEHLDYMLARVPMGRLARADEVAELIAYPRERAHDVLDRRRLRPLGRQADVLMGAFVPRGWRLVRLGGGAEPASARSTRPRRRSCASCASATRWPRCGAASRVRRRGRGRARRRGSREARAAAAARAARPRRDLGRRRDLRAQPARAHRGERILGRRVRARLRRRAPRAVPQGRRLPPHSRPLEAVAVRSESRWTVPEPELGLVLDADGSIMAVTGRQRPHGARHRGREPALPAAGEAVRRLLRLGPAVLVPDDPAAPYAISVRIWNAEGALVNEDAQHRRDAPQLRGARLLVRTREPLPAGSVLLTGTGVVPPDDVALAPGYRVEVEVEGIGVLANPVRAAYTGDVNHTPPPPALPPPPSVLRYHRDRLDLHLHPRHGQLPHAHERARRPRVAEERLAQRVDQRAVVDVREVDVDLTTSCGVQPRRPGWRRGS